MTMIIETMTFVGGPRDGETLKVRLNKDSRPRRIRIDGVIYWVRPGPVGLGRVLVDESAYRLYEWPPV